MTIPHEEAQKLSQTATIDLWRLDLSAWGETEKIAFTRHVLPDGSPVSFGGESFAPVEVKVSGFTWTGDGQPTEPTLTLPLASLSVRALLKQYDGLRGALVERIRTKRQFLDDGDDPDSSVHWPIEIWAVDVARIPASGNVVEIVLASPVDQAAVQLPGRVITRDYCPFTYRVWDADAEAFDYAHVFCPYTGANYFDVHGEIVATAAEDRCGKQLRDCELRFAGTGKIPFGGFPGVAKVRA